MFKSHFGNTTIIYSREHEGSLRGLPATNEEETEDRRAQRYYGCDPHNSTAINTMRNFWLPCRALDERIALANELQLTPHQDW